METIFISKCCKEKAVADYPVEEGNTNVVYACLKCENECEVEEVCADCLGTGEVTTIERVYAGEPHMADVGTAPCHCQKREEFEE